MLIFTLASMVVELKTFLWFLLHKIYGYVTGPCCHQVADAGIIFFLIYFKFGQMSFAEFIFCQMSFAKFMFCQMSLGWLTFGHISLGRLMFGQMPFGRLTSGHTSFGKLVFGQMSFGRLTLCRLSEHRSQIKIDRFWIIHYFFKFGWKNISFFLELKTKLLHKNMMKHQWMNGNAWN